jgi:hypothetical protein
VPAAYSFTARASDAFGCIGVRSYTLTVNCPGIDISPATLSNATQYAAYTTTNFNATGGTGPYLWDITSGALPTGMSFSTAGRLSGTPGSAPGSYSFTVRARDANNCFTTLPMTLTVVCPPITLTPATLGECAAVPGLHAGLLDGSGGSAPYTFAITAAACLRA